MEILAYLRIFQPIFHPWMTHLDFCQPWGTFIQPWEVWWVHAGVRNILQSQEEFLKDDQIFFCNFFSYREVWYIILFVLWYTNPMVWSKSLMDIILRIRDILHGSGRVLEKWPDLLLTIFVLQGSVIHQFLCTAWDNPIVSSKSLMDTILGISKIRHGSGRLPERWPDQLLTIFWATEKCDISIQMYFAWQILHDANGWQWLTLVDNGWKWLTMVDDGWRWLMMADNGWQWFIIVHDGSNRLMMVNIVDDGWWWLLMADDGWWWMMMDNGWWLMWLIIDDDVWWLMWLIINDWCWWCWCYKCWEF